MTEYFKIGTATIHLQGPNGDFTPVLDGVRRYLHSEKTHSVESPDLRLDMVVGETRPVLPEGAESLCNFVNGFTLWRDGEHVLIEGEGCLARLEPKGGKGTAWISGRVLERGQWQAACVLVVESLLILLRQYQLYAMHAAALAYGKRAALVVAPSDSGKSTLAFRLVQSGWDYLSDDTVLLHPKPTHVEVRGLRSPFSLDPEAQKLFPEIAYAREAPLLKEEKWTINVESIYPNRRRLLCEPQLLIFPQIEDSSASHVVPVSKVEALEQLLAQSSLARVKLDGAQKHFNVLARLAQSVPAYRLHSGRDLLENPARATELLTPLFN